MSREAAEIVRATFEAMGTSLPAAAAYWHPDIAYHEDPLWPGAGSYRGVAAVTRRFEEYAEVLATDLSIAVQEVHDAGEKQCALVRIAGTAFGSGAPHEHLWGYVARVQDGRVIFLRAYYDAAEALRAVELKD